MIEYLQEVLTAELTAINQYFLHAEMMENWGYHRLAAKTRKESIEEMGHAEKLLERMLYLDGSPNMTGCFRCASARPSRSRSRTMCRWNMMPWRASTKAIRTAVEVGDNGSRELFESILTDEEEHIDYLEAQLYMIKEMGYENYLSQHMHKEE